MSWYVLYTKSRSERAVAEKLSLLGIEVYCPVLRKKKLWSDRWKWVEEPLFSSYCFVYLDSAQRDQVFTVPGVVRYIYHCGKPAIIRDLDMELLKTMIKQYDHEAIQTFNFSVQDKIHIRSGALMDKKAEVLDTKGNYALVFLEDIGLKVKVDLRRNIVEKLTAR